MTGCIRAFMLAVLSLGLLSASAAIEDDLIQEQQELLRRYRAGETDPEEELQLARLSEAFGEYDTALELWQMLGVTYKGQPFPNSSSAPTCTLDEVASFFQTRVRMKASRAGRPMPPDRSALREMGSAVAADAEVQALEDWPGHVALSVQADLDGDAIDEIFMVGQQVTGHDVHPFICIAKWQGYRYGIVWRSGEDGKSMPLPPKTIRVSDYDGDGIKEVTLGFEFATDNAATLYFNGSSVVILQF